MIRKCCICGGETKIKQEIFYGDFIQVKGYERQKIAICEKCGYIFVANPLTLDETTQYYRETTRHDHGMTDASVAAYIKQSKRQKNFIMDNIDSIQTVLEVAATSGSNLNLYKEQGFDVYGTELSQRNIEYAKQKYNINLFHTDFDGFIHSNEKEYDLVILSAVLEHIIDPCSMMEKVSLLNSKYAFIEVPCFDYKFIDMPYGMFIPTHLSYFTLESLRNLMFHAGYELLDAHLLFGNGKSPIQAYSIPRIQTIWNKLDKSEKNKCLTMLQPTISSERYLDIYLEQSRIHLNKIASLIEKITNESRLAVYCLSRSTSLLFNNTSLPEKNIIKFYDKNEMFHNKQVAGKKVSPFSKEDIIENNIETILISSYEHQTSIIEMLKSSNIDCDIISIY